MTANPKSLLATHCRSERSALIAGSNVGVRIQEMPSNVVADEKHEQ
jgi:hypothetical protein